MYKSQIEFENEISRGFPLVSGIAHNLSYDIPHYHSEMEIVYVAEGTLTAICDGEALSIGSNEFFIFMPGVVHCFNKSQVNSFYYAKILPFAVPGGTDFSYLRPKSCAVRISDVLHSALIDAIKNLFGERERMRSGHDFAILRYSNEILENLLNHGGLSKIPRDEQTKVAAKLDLMQRVNKFIEENYSDKIELEEAARACGYSKFYFAHFFKDATQISFYNYVTSYRLEKAISMLRTANKSITDIAYECGFGSVRSFDRTFKKHYSASPTEYLQSKLSD